MYPVTLCTHLSPFTSSITPSLPLPAQQQEVSTVFMYVSSHYTFVFLYILHDNFFTTSCTKTGSKYILLFLFMSPSTLCAHLSLFTFSMTPSSPLPAQQQSVSTHVFMHVSSHFMYAFVSLYIFHDNFFTTSCTTTGSKYSCFYGCVHPLYVHICVTLHPP